MHDTIANLQTLAGKIDAAINAGNTGQIAQLAQIWTSSISLIPVPAGDIPDLRDTGRDMANKTNEWIAILTARKDDLERKLREIPLKKRDARQIRSAYGISGPAASRIKQLG